MSSIIAGGESHRNDSNYSILILLIWIHINLLPDQIYFLALSFNSISTGIEAQINIWNLQFFIGTSAWTVTQINSWDLRSI